MNKRKDIGMLQENFPRVQREFRPRLRYGKLITKWMPDEDGVIRDLCPDYHAIRRKLPHRTYHAIRFRAGALHLTKKRHKWTGAELNKLKKLYAGGCSREELLAAFPHATTWYQLKGEIRYHKFHREKVKLKLTGVAIIDAIRERAQKLNFSMAELDAEVKSNLYFQKATWRSKMNGKHIIRAIAVLGGSLSVNWEALTEG
jgi:hypothetical protein